MLSSNRIIRIYRFSCIIIPIISYRDILISINNRDDIFLVYIKNIKLFLYFIIINTARIYNINYMYYVRIFRLCVGFYFIQVFSTNLRTSNVQTTRTSYSLFYNNNILYKSREFIITLISVNSV